MSKGTQKERRAFSTTFLSGFCISDRFAAAGRRAGDARDRHRLVALLPAAGRRRHRARRTHLARCANCCFYNLRRRQTFAIAKISARVRTREILLTICADHRLLRLPKIKS